MFSMLSYGAYRLLTHEYCPCCSLIRLYNTPAGVEQHQCCTLKGSPATKLWFEPKQYVLKQQFGFESTKLTFNQAINDKEDAKIVNMTPGINDPIVEPGVLVLSTDEAGADNAIAPLPARQSRRRAAMQVFLQHFLQTNLAHFLATFLANNSCTFSSNIFCKCSVSCK